VVERGQRHNDQTSAEFQLCPANKRTIVAAPQIHTCQPQYRVSNNTWQSGDGETVITRMWANAQRDGRPAKYRWRPLFNAAKYGWRPLLECHAVTKPKRETRWNLQGCPKLTKRSQPLVGQSSPYYGDMWRRYCCLTSCFPIVDTCLFLRRYSPTICGMVPRWRFLATFASCICSEPRAAHFRPVF